MLPARHTDTKPDWPGICGRFCPLKTDTLANEYCSHQATVAVSVGICEREIGHRQLIEQLSVTMRSVFTWDAPQLLVLPVKALYNHGIILSGARLQQGGGRG